MPKVTKTKTKANRNPILQRKPKAFDGVIAEDTEFIDSKTTRKILKVAREQQNELEEKFGLTEPGSSEAVTSGSSGKKAVLPKLSGEFSDHEHDDMDYSSLDEQEETTQDYYESFYEELNINKDDEKALEMFMTKDNLKRKTLADYIQGKLKEKDNELSSMLNDGQDETSKFTELDDRVVEVYRGVKFVLSRYRSGKLPKPFKIIPSLSNWEQVLAITEPDCWSAAAMFQATRIFASNLKEKMAQRFFNLILLPRLRDDIEEFKRLNFHLYQAVHKALFKPGAFFKGIILPLCEAGDCTLREAVIIGSVMGRHHIPILHSCCAMLKIAEMDYSGANSVFLHILINKKYALPYRVIDSLFHHFYRFINDKRALPVLWHQCLLAFVQIYKKDLSNEQKECLLEVLRVQNHYQITPEIRKELFDSINRDGTEFAAPGNLENIEMRIQ